MINNSLDLNDLEEEMIRKKDEFANIKKYKENAA